MTTVYLCVVLFSMVAFHPDISRLLLYSAGEDYKVRVWDLTTSKCVAEVAAHYSLVTSVDFSADGSSIYTYVLLSLHQYFFNFNPYRAGTEVISFCHWYRALPACQSVQYDHALYCWLTNFMFSS